MEEETTQQPMKISITIGEVNMEIPLIELDLLEKYIDLTLGKVKSLMSDEGVKKYLDVVKAKKQNGGLTYTE